MYVTNGSCTERRSSCAWAYEKSIKISFYPSESAGAPLTGWRDSIDRQIGPADYGRTRGGGAPVRECLALTLKCPVPVTYVHGSQIHTHAVARVPIAGARGHANALTRTHFRHASLNNGINRPWRVINCRCPPDMTVYSFVRRANVPNICGIPSVGSGLKSDAVFSTYFTLTRAHTYANVRPRANERERARLTSIHVAVTRLSFIF